MICPNCSRKTLDFLDQEDVEMVKKGMIPAPNWSRIFIYQCPKCMNIEVKV